MNTKKTILLSFISFVAAFIFIFFAVPYATASAAEIHFESASQPLYLGDDFLVKVTLNTEGQSINAVEGKVAFPGDSLEVKEISDGNSALNFWVEKPHVTAAGTISFAGVIPGGISSGKAHLFSIIFHAKNTGGGAISLGDLKILLNDGNGTAASAKQASLQLSVGPSNGQTPKTVSVSDTKDSTAPENFKPEIASSPNVFDGKYFLVFSTQDKNSGVNRYEVKEGILGKYEKAESPYVLKNQRVVTKVHIKAVDGSGNERDESIYPPNWMFRQNMPLWSIVILILIIGLWIRRGKRS